MKASLADRVTEHLKLIYQNADAAFDAYAFAAELLGKMRLRGDEKSPKRHRNPWSANDVVLITYADTFYESDQKPLRTLRKFLDRYAATEINSVHILPFFPFSSDDGFSIIDFYQVNNEFGSWEDIESIARRWRLMADLVINHCSAESVWFKNFLADKQPGRDYFCTADPSVDLSQVVRPRTSPLLRAVKKANGTDVQVWCTFSPDQVDLNFRNPRVLVECVNIIRYYLDKGVKIFRLDAIAFLWKSAGSTCINLPQTHEIVRLLRVLIEHVDQDAVLITETNIPNRENLEYLGNAHEAHWVYNFSLPPLLVHALVTGKCKYLKQWIMSMPPARNGTAYFNFIASHDGIGLRPVEGLLTDREVDSLLALMENFGGKFSYRTSENGVSKPYEINIALLDALQGTFDGPDGYAVDRLICAHAIMLGLEGIPGIYVHSLLGTHNDYQRMAATGHYRSINRHRWDYQTVCELLDGDSEHATIYRRLRELLAIRMQQQAFHPNATQFTLHLNDEIFGFWRQSLDKGQNIFCLSNISNRETDLHLYRINLIDNVRWRDLITGYVFDDRSERYRMQPYQTLWVSNY